jgi:histidinol-phosphate/aromatic aminotransferase/cobyric acid decarboxylase-like protein
MNKALFASKPETRPAPCFHGGAFFQAIGEHFDHLERRRHIINADVLDAWFPPAPGVLAALQEHLPWLVRTSPPADCGGLLRTIASARGLDPQGLVPGAGSSDLIFRGLRHWLRPTSRVLLLDPTYGEYNHVLERVIGCKVHRLPLTRDGGYVLDLKQLVGAIACGYDLIVLVNPNSPTGRHVRRDELETVLRRVPPTTRVWIDETYTDYVGPGQSLESFAASTQNVVVCKSMSKVYALSGARVAYLCACRRVAAELRAITPPWCVGLLSQVAAVAALKEPAYYRQRYTETHALRGELEAELAGLDLAVVPGVANFLLCHLPEDGPDAADVVARCRTRGLFLRDVGSMGCNLGRHALRIAVKGSATQQQMMKILGEVLLGTKARGESLHPQSITPRCVNHHVNP